MAYKNESPMTHQSTRPVKLTGGPRNSYLTVSMGDRILDSDGTTCWFVVGFFGDRVMVQNYQDTGNPELYWAREYVPARTY